LFGVFLFIFLILERIYKFYLRGVNLSLAIEDLIVLFDHTFIRGFYFNLSSCSKIGLGKSLS